MITVNHKGSCSCGSWSAWCFRVVDDENIRYAVIEMLDGSEWEAEDRVKGCHVDVEWFDTEAEALDSDDMRVDSGW